MAKPPKSATVSLPALVTRYAAGESLQDIAPDYKVSVRTLYRWLLAGLGDKKYYQQVTHCLTNRIADADMELEAAEDACQIARARGRARFARMDLERRRPALYGLKPVAVQVNVEHQTVVSAGEIAGLVAESVARLRHAAVLPAIEPGTDIAEDE